MARPAEFDAAEVVRRATQYFWRQGYGGTGIRDLLAATGCHRRALYEHFGGKPGLFAQALDDYAERYLGRIFEILSGPDAGLEALAALLEFRLGGDTRLGCLVMNTLGEKSSVEPRTYRAARRYHGRIAAGVRQCIETAQAAGDIDPSRDAGQLAAHVMTVLHGLGPASRAGMSAGEARQAAAATIDYLRAPA